MKKLLTLLVVLVSVLVLSACQPKPKLTIAEEDLTVALTVGQNKTIEVTVNQGELEWVSGNTSIVTVTGGNTSGVITAVGAGTAKITVSIKDTAIKAEITVTVTLPVATAVTITGAGNVVVGSALQLTGAVTPAAASQTLTWVSNNTSVATVSATGLVTGVGAGEAKITATSSVSTVKAEVTIQVVLPDPTGITVTGPNEVIVGQTGQFASAVTPAIAPAGVTWTTSDVTKATVDAAGLVTGVAVGTVQVIATSTAKGTIFGQKEIQVVLPVPTGITVTGDATVLTGETATYSAAVAPALASQGVTWTTSDVTKATINATTGVLSAIAAGTVNVIATSTVLGTVTGQLQVTIESSGYVVEFETNGGLWSITNQQHFMPETPLSSHAVTWFNPTVGEYYASATEGAYLTSIFLDDVNRRMNPALYGHRAYLKQNADGFFEIMDYTAAGVATPVLSQFDYVLYAHSSYPDGFAFMATLAIGQIITLEGFDIDEIVPGAIAGTINVYAKTAFLTQEQVIVDTDDDDFELPIPAKVLHEFLGWYINAAFTGDPVTEITSNVKLYAKWENLVDTSFVMVTADYEDGESFYSEVTEKTMYMGLNAFKTLAEALAVVGEGGTVYMLEGEYEDAATVAKDNITITGDQGAVIKALINVAANVDGLTISGLSFTGVGSVVGSTAGGITNFTFVENRIFDTTASMGFLLFWTATDTAINSDFIIMDNVFEIVDATAIGTRYIRGGNITNLIIMNNTFEGIQGQYSDAIRLGGTGAELESNSAGQGLGGVVIIQNNEFTNIGQRSVWIRRYSATQIDITQNLFDFAGDQTYGGAIQLETWVPGQETEINVKFNTFKNIVGTFGVRLNIAAMLETATWEAFVQYNKFIDFTGGTHYYVQAYNAATADPALKLVDAEYNYYSVDPVAAKLPGVSSFANNFATEKALEDAIDDLIVVTYSVTFESNGGSTVAKQFVDDGDLALKPANPTKEGFLFEGWFADVDLLLPFDFDDPIEDHITVYAKWSVDEYYVLKNAVLALAAGKTAQFPGGNVDAFLTGYGFNGYTITHGTDKVLFIGMNGYIPLRALEASETVLPWQAVQPYTVGAEAKFNNGINVNGPTAAGVTPLGTGAVYHNPNDSAVVVNSKQLYGFQHVDSAYSYGLYGKALVDKDGLIKINFTAADLNAGLQITLEPGDYLLTCFQADRTALGTAILVNPNFAAGQTITITYTAGLDYPFEVVEFDVTFESNGGSLVAAQVVVEGEKVVKPVDPTKDGFTFGGWFEDVDLLQAFDFDTIIDANTTLYAKWAVDTSFVLVTTEHEDDASFVYDEKTFIKGHNAFDTLDEALAVVAENGVVFLVEGEYDAAATVTTNGVTITGEAGAVIKATINVAANVDGLTIDRLEFTGEGKVMMALAGGISNFTFTNNHVYDATAEVVNSAVIFFRNNGTANNSNFVISNNTFEVIDALDTPRYIRGGNVVNLTITDNYFEGIQFIYTDTIRIEGNNDLNSAGVGLSGVVNISDNEFINTGQRVVWARRYSTTEFTFNNNLIEFAGGPSGGGGVQLEIWVPGQTTAIEINYNTFKDITHGYFAVRLNNTTAWTGAEDWSVNINYNKFINFGLMTGSLGTTPIRFLQAYSDAAKDLINADYNYFSSSPDDADRMNFIGSYANAFATEAALDSYLAGLEEHTVIFDVDGGSVVDPQLVFNDEKAVEPTDPTKAGFVFGGWFTDVDKTLAFDFDTLISDSITLYAKWSEEVTVTFNVDGGSAVVAQVIASGEKAIEPVDPTKAGYDFAGWFSDADLLIAYDFDDPVDDDVTIYAKWTVATLSVTYNLDEGYWTYPNKDAMLVDLITDLHTFVGATESLSDFMHGVGKTSGFDGLWHSNTTYRAKIYDGARPTNVDDTKNLFVWSTGNYEKWLPFFDLIDELTKDINATQFFFGAGTWTGFIRLREYVVGITTNYGAARLARMPKFVEVPVAFTLETDDFNLPTPIRAGYMFAGWFAAADFTGAAITKVEKGTLENVALFAKWGVPMTVTFNVDGADAIAPVVLPQGEKLVRPADPEKEGYDFLGWFTDVDKTLAFDFNTVIDANMTLYAKFALSTFSVTYNLNEGYWAYANKDAMLVELITDLYTFVNPTESLSDFMHGVGKTSGFDGLWHSNTTYRAKIYDGTRPTNVDDTKNLFVWSTGNYEKWLPFFDLIDELVKDINPIQFFFGAGTWTGFIRLREYVVGITTNYGAARLARMPKFVEVPVAFTMETADFDLPTPIRAGFVFAGWFGAADFSGDAITEVEEGTVENVVLFAKWDVPEVEITGDSALNIGEEITLVAEITPDFADQDITWSTSNAAIATIDTEGKLTAVTAGLVTITATSAYGTTSTFEVRVYGAPTSVSFRGPEAFVLGGNGFPYGQVYTASGQVADQTAVTYASNNTDILTVDAVTGEVTPVAEGTATITITSTIDGTKSGSKLVTVYPTDHDFNVTTVFVASEFDEFESFYSSIVYTTVFMGYNAFDNLQDALAAVAADGRVYVMNGTYEGPGAVTKDGITINGASGAIIKGAITVSENVDGLTVDGLTFSGGSSINMNAGGVTNFTFKNNVVTGLTIDTGTFLSFKHNGVAANNSDFDILNNIFEVGAGTTVPRYIRGGNILNLTVVGNSFTGIKGQYVDGIRIEGTNESATVGPVGAGGVLTISDNEFINLGQRAVWIRRYSTTAIIFEDNYVYSAGGSTAGGGLQIEVYVAGTNTTMSIQRNTFESITHYFAIRLGSLTYFNVGTVNINYNKFIDIDTTTAFIVQCYAGATNVNADYNFFSTTPVAADLPNVTSFDHMFEYAWEVDLEIALMLADPIYGVAVFEEDLETVARWSAYPTTDQTKMLGGLEWTVKEVLLNPDANDKLTITPAQGDNVFRFRGANTAYLYMNEFVDGITTLSFDAKLYAAHTDSVFKVSKMVEGGAWVEVATIPLTSAYATYYVDINETGNVKIRFDATVRSVNLDNIVFYQSEEVFVQKFQAQYLPGDLIGTLGIATYNTSVWAAGASSLVHLHSAGTGGTYWYKIIIEETTETGVFEVTTVIEAAYTFVDTPTNYSISFHSDAPTYAAIKALGVVVGDLVTFDTDPATLTTGAVNVEVKVWRPFA